MWTRRGRSRTGTFRRRTTWSLVGCAGLRRHGFDRAAADRSALRRQDGARRVSDAAGRAAAERLRSGARDVEGRRSRATSRRAGARRCTMAGSTDTAFDTERQGSVRQRCKQVPDAVVEGRARDHLPARSERLRRALVERGLAAGVAQAGDEPELGQRGDRFGRDADQAGPRRRRHRRADGGRQEGEGAGDRGARAIRTTRSRCIWATAASLRAA